jgi:hypothetical protein
MNMSENLKVNAPIDNLPLEITHEVQTVKITPSSDGKSFIITLTDFAENPSLYVNALSNITTRPIQLKFV